MKPEVSIVIVNYKTPELVVNCVKSLERFVTATSFEVIVVDNDSTKESVDLMKQYCPRITIIANPQNSGFGEGNNIGYRHAKGNLLFLLNSDTVLREDTVTPLVKFLNEHPEAAMVGPTVFLPNGLRQSQICGNNPTLRRLFNDALLLSLLLPSFSFFQGIHRDSISQKVTRVTWISGVCMLIRKEAYRKVNGFNPEFFLYSEDIDLCLRVNRDCGDIYHLNDYGIIHHHGASSKTEEAKLQNSLLQQGNFLKLLPTVLSSPQIKKARMLLKIGLLLRLCIGYLLRLLGRSRGRFLVLSCHARLAALKEIVL